MKKLHLLFLACVALLLVACNSGSGGGSTAQVSETNVAVNGFGSAANHVHSLLVLPDAEHTLVMATHYGIFRSQDHGMDWQKTATGPNQLMQGLMTYSLSSNPLNSQRLYVLTLPATFPYAGTLGLYTSGDSGKSWQLAISDASVTKSTIYFAQAGNESSSEVYIYLSDLGPRGLLVSKDNGQHFAQAGSPLPFGTAQGLLPIPGQPGHLLLYSNQGIASTIDGGAHWQVVSGVQDSIFEMTTPGPNQPIYAEGYNGVYASSNGGQSFSLVYTQHSFDSLTVSPQQPDVLYGKLGLGVYRSSDGGKSWSELPIIQSSKQALLGDILTADPTNQQQVYLALSYPTKVYHFQSTQNAWQSLTPSV